MPANEWCPNCAGVLGASPHKCDYCRVYDRGVRRHRALAVVAIGLALLVGAAGSQWLASRRAAPAASARAILLGIDAFHGTLSSKPGDSHTLAFAAAERRGLTLRKLTDRLTPESLAPLDALWLGDFDGHADAGPEEVRAVSDWVSRGGVFLANPLVWVAEAYGHKKAPAVNVNQLVAPMGIFFSPTVLTNDARLPGTPAREYDIVFTAETMASDRLLDGVATLGFNGAPGRIEIQRGDVLIWGRDRKQGAAFERQPFLIRVPFGHGVVIGYQHEALFGNDALSGTSQPFGRSYDNARLWDNLMEFIKQRHRER